jgi:protoporphyrinogen oxidase
MKIETLIAGGGLAGLACARSLAQSGRPFLLVEREKETGGLCRTIETKGFTFDYTGHFLHFQDPRLEEWVLSLTAKLLKPRRRHSAIHSQGVFTEYPYQENNAGLPSATVRENVMGYLKAALRQRFLPAAPPESHFKDWCLKNFGPGISRHFMFPYNSKLWKTPLARLTTHWMGRFVPRPQVRRVLEGALRRRPSETGYNATFLYPDRGGISVLPRALARDLPNLWRGVGLRSLESGKRRVRLTTGVEVRFDRLVSSLPLRALAGLTRDLPSPLRRAAASLKSVSIYNLNLGVRGRQPMPYSWVYFPEPEFLFHRAGSVSACVPGVAPAGFYSLYVEFSYRGQKPDPERLYRHTLEKLGALGWIRSPKDIVARVDLDLPGAYVLYDKKRDEIAGELLAFYRKKGILSVGRYGLWEYGSMESALKQGLEAVCRTPSGQAVKPML